MLEIFKLLVELPVLVFGWDKPCLLAKLLKLFPRRLLLLLIVLERFPPERWVR